MSDEETVRLPDFDDNTAGSIQRIKLRRPLRCVIGSWPLLVSSVVIYGAALFCLVRSCGTMRLGTSNNTFSTGYVRKESVTRLGASNNTYSAGYIRKESVMYGHVHMAKTAGTTINGELATHFERVCGHKGYSYDAHKANSRWKHSDKWQNMNDSFSKIHHGYNRGRVPPSIMDEIGFEDCDYVSSEEIWRKWTRRFDSWNEPLELHVPCRDPIDHLMSQCNHLRIDFNCSSNEQALLKGIHKCLGNYMQRFSNALVKHFPNIHVKCYDFQNTSSYLQYMGERLQRKRIETDYVFRPTGGRPRKKRQECIWNDKETQKLVRAYMIENIDYYNFCDGCVESEDDLLKNFRWQPF